MRDREWYSVELLQEKGRYKGIKEGILCFNIDMEAWHLSMAKQEPTNVLYCIVRMPGRNPGIHVLSV